MIYPEISTEEWCEKHDLKVIEVKCPKCGLLQHTTIPFIAKKCLGLEAPLHECGVHYRAAAVVSRDPAKRARWKNLANEMMETNEEGEE